MDLFGSPAISVGGPETIVFITNMSKNKTTKETFDTQIYIYIYIRQTRKPDFKNSNEITQ